MLNKKEIDYILKNDNAETSKLLFAIKEQDDSINYKLCISCIEGRKKIKCKVPEWYKCNSIIYPQSLPLEQCSSQATALFKQKIVREIISTCKLKNTADITGGMGIDSYYISKTADKHYYFERNKILCGAAADNFHQLKVNNISVECVDICKCTDILNNKGLALIYADPARRDRSGSKMVSITDCEPNILAIKEQLFKYADYLLIKLSPMADISLIIQQLKETCAIYTISVENECKELLFLLKKEHTEKEIPITATELNRNGEIKYSLTFSRERENRLNIEYADKCTLGQMKYLYDPGKAVLKSGAFKYLSQKYNIIKIAPATHLYISNKRVAYFPGRTFNIVQIDNFGKETINSLHKTLPKANLRAQNFPISSEALRRKMKIEDGGDDFLFAFTTADGSRKIVEAKLSKE